MHIYDENFQILTCRSLVKLHVISLGSFISLLNICNKYIVINSILTYINTEYLFW